MAYAFKDAKGWVADFRPCNWKPPAGFKGRPRQRIPRERWEKSTDPKATCDAYAQACDRACRLLERGVFTSRDVSEALRLGAITEAQSQALLDGNPAPESRGRKGSPTLEQAALAHPSSKRQPAAERLKYLAFLGQFQAHAGVQYVREVTLTHVQDWIAHLVAEEDSWDTRRHRLLYVRRATRMGAAIYGLPDPLAGFRLDQKGRRAAPPVNTIDELATAIARLQHRLAHVAELPEAERDRERSRCTRALAAIGLGAFCGLGPTETFRPLISALAGDCITTGSKNDSRPRTLPIPATVLRWVKDLARGRPATQPLFLNDRGEPFNEETWSKWFARMLPEVFDKPLQPKALRKSFATWTARAGIDVQHVEAYLGHDSALVAKVTSRHYLGDWLVLQLRPTAAKIDAQLVAALKRVAKKARAAEAAAIKVREEKRSDLHHRLSVAAKRRSATPPATTKRKSLGVRR